MNETEQLYLMRVLGRWSNKQGNRFILLAYNDNDDAVCCAIDKKSFSLRNALTEALLHDEGLWDDMQAAHELAKRQKK